MDHISHLSTDGFAFVEFSDAEARRLTALFLRMGFRCRGHHRHKNITLFAQGNVVFLLNTEPSGASQNFRARHGSGISAMGFRVKNGAAPLSTAVGNGARAAAHRDLDAAAIEGIGQSLIYLIDTDDVQQFFAREFDMTPATIDTAHEPLLLEIDHLTHNVERGSLSRWIDFYRNVFGFRSARSFEINGEHTGLLSQVLESVCGKIRIPINESADDVSQIEEFLTRYNGEGIQHVALSSGDIYASVGALQNAGIPFQSTPDHYYVDVALRLPDHGEDIDALRRLGVLLDGGEAQGGGKLLQIFTRELIGPIFFEVI